MCSISVTVDFPQCKMYNNNTLVRLVFFYFYKFVDLVPTERKILHVGYHNRYNFELDRWKVVTPFLEKEMKNPNLKVDNEKF